MSDDKGVLAQRRDGGTDEAGRRPLAIQSHACVLVLGDDWKIFAASENCRDLLGQSAQGLRGRTLSGIFSDEAAHDLRMRAQVLSASDPVIRIPGCALRSEDVTVDVTATRIGADTCFECEPSAHGLRRATDAEQVRRLASRAAERATLAEAAQDAARTISALTGFARVSVHRIGKAGLDAALALTDSPSLTGPPGRTVLAAQAGDFPPQLNLIPDVADTATSPVVVARGGVAPVRAEIRGLSCAAPSEVLGHALARDNVQAAMTIPVRVAGDLWGAILCHHHAPMLPSVEIRGALALFAHLFGHEIERLQYRLAARARGEAAELRGRIGRSLADGSDLSAAIRDSRDGIAGLIAHDGRVLWHNGRFESEGHAVTQDEFDALFAALRLHDGRAAIAIDRLTDLSVFPRSIDSRNTALMVLPLSQAGRDFLLLFRRLGADEDRLHSWESWEIEAAHALRAILIETQFELSGTAREAGIRSQERQGLVMAELTHRMRNMLNLIQGLVGQGLTEGNSVEDYARVLEARILALARAHDDLAEHDWGRVGLRVLLERELDGYLDAAGPTARITGDRIDLSPAAFTTMAPVLHELVSNARDHGALSTPTGRVDVEMTLGEDGFAHLVWTETGGPEPVRPESPGFGLTVIEKSVPFELRGMSELEFAPGGLVARFALPPGHVTRQRPESGLQAAAPNQEAAPDDILIDGAALILDDSLLIAIESADLLRAAGASEVYSCNSVDAALNALDNGDVTFALLDVNLGEETSLAVAEQLWSDGIPAVLATGYGANEDLLTDFPPMPVLSKPYTVAELKEVLRHFRARARG